MIHLISDILFYSYLLFGVIYLYILLFKSFKLKYLAEISGIKPYVYLLIFGAFYEVIFTAILRVPSAYWVTPYTLFEFLTLSYFFSKVLKSYRLIFSFFVVIFIMFFFASLFFWNLENHMKIEAYHLALETIFVFTYTVLWFKDLFKKPEIVPLWQTPAFYFITGNVLYFTGSIFLFLFIDIIYKSSGLISKYWILALFLGAVMRIMMIIGLLKATVKKP
ncbi:hypothetical protein [Flavobacterium beibuense]|uniref:hypothetical protein n=1 Tax=Flavobacterium beibuense TaxID=657326 RepID=UPI003A91FCB7